MATKQAWQIESLILAKQNRRRELAKLPFEKKIKILVEMQKTLPISNSRRKNKLPVWDIAS
jgi:hypothetical protein